MVVFLWWIWSRGLWTNCEPMHPNSDNVRNVALTVWLLLWSDLQTACSLADGASVQICLHPSKHVCSVCRLVVVLLLSNKLLTGQTVAGVTFTRRKILLNPSAPLALWSSCSLHMLSSLPRRQRSWVAKKIPRKLQGCSESVNMAAEHILSEPEDNTQNVSTSLSSWAALQLWHIAAFQPDTDCN